MQEHPIPRQITTFEFKLIGELTIKQFGYLAAAAASAVFLFFLTPKVFYLNFLVAALPALLGIGFAFVPINDRPMDIWLKNLFKRLLSPTQYYYRKHNLPPKILLGLQLPPREVLLQHIKAQQSLNEYLQKKPRTDVREEAAAINAKYEDRKKNIQTLINAGSLASAVVPREDNFTTVSMPVEKIKESSAVTFEGTVTTKNGLPLPGLIVYVKKGEETIRLFRTDKDGHFRNNLPLPSGDYFLEVNDPQKKRTFARMKIDGSATNLEIKET